jgi:hypothetical protein
MRLIVSFAALLISCDLIAQTPKGKNIEFCQETNEKEGLTYTLGHSLFVDNEDPKGKGTLFNYKSNFNRPITHTYTFSAPIKHKLWLGCTYNGDGPTFIEYVEINTIPTQCTEIMYPEHQNRVQYFKCKSAAQKLQSP